MSDGRREALPDLTILAARYYPDVHGGVETHMDRFSRQLARQGVRVRVLTENRTGAALREALEPGLSVVRDEPLDPGALWRVMAVARLRAWRRFLRRHRPEGPIWASCPLLATAAILAGHGRQVIFNPAACVAGMRRIGRLYPHVDTMRGSRVTGWADRFAYRRSPRMVVSSENVRRQYERFHGLHGDMTVLPLAAGGPGAAGSRVEARRGWGIEAGAFVVGLVGRLDPCKGADFLLEAWQRAGLRPSGRLLIVGDGPDGQRLAARIAALGLDRQVVFTGRLEDPGAAYAAMDVLAVPSVYEAFGLVAVEAMAAGVPAIGRRGNGESVMTACEEIIDHGRTGLLCDSHDPGDLARQLRWLERCAQERRRLGVRARARAAQWTWRHYALGCIDRFGLGAAGAVGARGVRHAA